MSKSYSFPDSLGHRVFAGPFIFDSRKTLGMDVVPAEWVPRDEVFLVSAMDGEVKIARMLNVGALESE